MKFVKLVHVFTFWVNKFHINLTNSAIYMSPFIFFFKFTFTLMLVLKVCFLYTNCVKLLHCSVKSSCSVSAIR